MKTVSILIIGFGSLVILAGLLLIGIVAFVQPETNLIPSRLPNRLAYPTHAALGTVFRYISPEHSAAQWLKAASHARGPEDISRAAAGIRAALQRAAPTDHLNLDVCMAALHGSLSVQAAVREAGVSCPSDLSDRHHVAEGMPVPYQTRPPIAGPHYDTPYSPYGVVDHTILPGFWVHNLEHGAIVVLYNCPAGCPDLVAQIRALIATLPPNRNNPGGAPRLLAIPYSAMDHRLSLIAWGHLRELDSFDGRRIATFYTAFVDQGPECRGLICPP